MIATRAGRPTLWDNGAAWRYSEPATGRTAKAVFCTPYVPFDGCQGCWSRRPTLNIISERQRRVSKLVRCDDEQQAWGSRFCRALRSIFVGLHGRNEMVGIVIGPEEVDTAGQHYSQGKSWAPRFPARGQDGARSRSIGELVGGLGWYVLLPSCQGRGR